MIDRPFPLRVRTFRPFSLHLFGGAAAENDSMTSVRKILPLRTKWVTCDGQLGRETELHGAVLSTWWKRTFLNSLPCNAFCFASHSSCPLPLSSC
jgi:hypothetical protein